MKLTELYEIAKNGDVVEVDFKNGETTTVEVVGEGRFFDLFDREEKEFIADNIMLGAMLEAEYSFEESPLETVRRQSAIGKEVSEPKERKDEKLHCKCEKNEEGNIVFKALIEEAQSESMVYHPNHYNDGYRRECWDEMVQIFGVEATVSFCMLNVYKYLYRAGLKEGNTYEMDREKAKNYYKKALELSKDMNKTSWNKINRDLGESMLVEWVTR